MEAAKVLTPMETFMSSLGLNEPGLRFLTLFTVTNLMVWLVKPPYLFDDDGYVNAKALIPWWTPGVVVGGVAAMFL
jgi:hypothetical protein